MNGGLAKFSRYLLAGASVIGLLAFGAPEAKAQNLQEIQAQIDQMQATIKALQKQVQDAKAEAAAAPTAADSAKGSDLDLKVKWKGAPEFSSGDGKFKMKVRGRLEVDYNNIDQDTRSPASRTSAPPTSGVPVSASKAFSSTTVKYVLEVDFANNAVAVKDAYLAISGLQDWRQRRSYSGSAILRRYNSLEDDDQRSLHRPSWSVRRSSTPSDIDRQIGAALMLLRGSLHVGRGHLRRKLRRRSDAPLFPGFIGDENMTFAARATVAPINREVNGVNQVLHFGASVQIA